jgi:hypothetical protein
MALAAGFGLFLVAGCNGSVTADPPGSGGSGGGTGSTTAGPTAGSTGTSTGSGGICAGFEDAKSTTTVTVRFHNNTGLPVYLPALCSNAYYEIKPTSGDDGVTYNFEPSCLQTCFDLQTQPGLNCGGCAPLSYLIAPGATREVAWDARGMKPSVAMPASCYAEPHEGECPEIVGAPAGKYDITGLGFGSCGDGCKCTPEGVCTGSAEGLQAYADPVTLDFPAEAAVDVIFGVCAFGCAGGTP